MATSVILSTYNQPEWLEKCLLGYAAQDRLDFEVVIADDGSRDDTRALLDAMRPRLPFDLVHVWQEDAGFRKCRALNLAVLAASGDYLLFSDGDCIPRPDFVSVHLREREPGRFLSGGYCKLPRALSLAISSDDIASGRATDAAWLRASGMKRRTLKIARHPLWRQRVLNALTPTRPRWHGHNASAWKSDIVRVNGFDERLSYGAEDLEFGDRLVNAGVRGKQIRFSAVCVHLDHDRGYVQPGMRDANEALRAVTIRERLVWAVHGLDGHRGPPVR
ncbi:glycosyltransferase family 2 protein [Pseudofulvimonas gallinarii]|jgi:glycosyltransferase involved in cell wall biosynthesis|uniref:Glycosyltransferase involved in cell wall biosynthesis n=1 Tax=Pseudofulvimonas gallinarii TaxID=634155 RepID=A0A4S3KXX0_9GAMM|nr:glycosyltransferase family 2 protein [Pseudofulvimonas gallinarii]TCT00255.1 glycosyltransferase involved in cell wall biosynthesis [Pseudofulvimonas gallinarii]THD14100.1 glycosyl transferase family 2 [Pseudofulvimonas gallinarii]